MIGTVYANNDLNAVLGGDRGAVTLHVHTGSPGTDGANELAGYDPITVTGLWNPAADGEATNAALFVFEDLPAATLSHFSLHVAGVFWCEGEMDEPVTVAAGGTLEIPPGALAARSGGGTAEEPVGPISLLIIPEARRTVWDPGIEGDIPTERVVHATLSSLTTNGTGDNSAAINAAITAAGAAYAASGVIQEVVLPAGTIRCTQRITINVHGVVLRGQPNSGAHDHPTRIRFDSGGDSLAIRIARSAFWGGGTGRNPKRLVQNAARGDREIVVANADAANIFPGDILCIDEEDDLTYLRWGGGYVYNKRQPGGGDNWGPGLRVYASGTCTVALNTPISGRATITDPTKSWSVNELVGMRIINTNGTTTTEATVISNTATQIVVAGSPPAGTYNVYKWRSVTSLIRIEGKTVGATNTTLTLRDPLHMPFRTSLFAEVWHLVTKYTASRPESEGIHYSGIEDLYVTGGGVDVARAAYCWVRNVESDGFPGTPNIGTYTNEGGTGDVNIRVVQSYRCVVRGCYIHHKRNIVQGGGGYLLNVSAYTSESLFEDNICVFGNKLIVGEMMGGGNVIAYNYCDGAATYPSAEWQEGAIDLNHRMHTHNALAEGNEAVNLVSDTTHGSAGLHVFFRNFAYGRNRAKIHGAYPYTVVSDSAFQRAAGCDGYHREATYIGNVLHADETVVPGSRIYQRDHAGALGGAAVWRIGQAWQGAGDTPDNGQALAETYRHLNWDNVNGGIADEDEANTEPLPASLYLTSKPAWFGAHVWPPVNPNGSTAGDRYSTIPAKARYDAIGA